MRASGKGPPSLVNPKGPPGFQNIAELANTRVFSNLVLSGLKEKGWWDWWLWDTWMGQAFQKGFDSFAVSLSQKEARFDRTDAKEGYQLLKNDSP